jgi:protein tyrosine/serine phosphatase
MDTRVKYKKWLLANRRWQSCLLVILLFFAACAQKDRPATWAKAVQSRDVENFFAVDEDLYRSAQPSHAAMLELEKMGIKTVLDLRNFDNDKDEAKETKLKLIQVPINTWQINDESVVRALRIIADKSYRPLLVHCKHGADRTGTIIAMYRIVIQGWTKEDALKELTDGGFGYHPIWTNIPEYIKAANIDKIKKEVANTSQSEAGQAAAVPENSREPIR